MVSRLVRPSCSLRCPVQNAGYSRPTSFPWQSFRFVCMVLPALKPLAGLLLARAMCRSAKAPLTAVHRFINLARHCSTTEIYLKGLSLQCLLGTRSELGHKLFASTATPSVHVFFCLLRCLQIPCMPFLSNQLNRSELLTVSNALVSTNIYRRSIAFQDFSTERGINGKDHNDYSSVTIICDMFIYPFF